MIDLKNKIIMISGANRGMVMQPQNFLKKKAVF